MSPQEIEDFEKSIAFDYARAHNVWYDDFHALGDKPLVGGNEHTLRLDTKEIVVYKSNNLVNSRYLITNVIEKVEIHNTLFPETRYTIMGFTGIDNGKNETPNIEVVLGQNYMPGLTKAEPFEIKLFMENLGFEQTTPESYVNGRFLVFDLFPRNVLKDAAGTLYVVDAEFRDIERLNRPKGELEFSVDGTYSKLEEALHSIGGVQGDSPTYLTPEHKRNSEVAMDYWKHLDASRINWDKEVEMQKINAMD